jgi:hypothetical protein
MKNYQISKKCNLHRLPRKVPWKFTQGKCGTGSGPLEEHHPYLGAPVPAVPWTGRQGRLAQAGKGRQGQARAGKGRQRLCRSAQARFSRICNNGCGVLPTRRYRCPARNVRDLAKPLAARELERLHGDS